MSDARDDPDIFWVEPKRRAIIPLDGFRPSRSLAKVIRQDRYRVSLNEDFAGVIAAWVARTPWIANLAEDPATESNTSVCLVVSDPDVVARGPEAVASVAKGITTALDREGVALGIGAYRDAPPGLRIWCGATVEASRVTPLLSRRDGPMAPWRSPVADEQLTNKTDRQTARQGRASQGQRAAASSWSTRSQPQRAALRLQIERTKPPARVDAKGDAATTRAHGLSELPWPSARSERTERPLGGATRRRSQPALCLSRRARKAAQRAASTRVI